MESNIDDDGNITMYQGDSGTVVVDGLDTDKNYKVYFAISDKKRNFIGDELMVQSEKKPCVTFVLTSQLTDLLTVPQKAKSEIYYYGIKICLEDTGKEKTVIINNGNIGSLNTIKVYPKKVEGTK